MFLIRPEFRMNPITFLKNLSLFIVFIILLSQAKILIFSDISVEPILAPSPARDNKFSVYLVSYADGPEIFHKNQNALTASALNKGVDFFLNYKRSHLDKGFLEQNKSILFQKKGAGYWLWKPWVILKTLQSVEENAIVIYADSGFVFHTHLQPLIDLALQHRIILVDYDTTLHGTLGQITKRETLEKMGCDTPTCRQGKHLWAAFSIFRNTPESRAFVKKWLEYCLDESLLTDIPSHSKEYPEFCGHAHDESILSTLYNLEPNGKHLITVPEFYKYADWHHRHPGREFESLLPKMGKLIRGVERKVLNSSWMISLRKFVLEKFFLT
ncbi:MAG: hypothetical protein K2W94_00420 [Alphaproteobacteria bacterium]|nr:hypothetical protein [Alphaproteobacteria bacterium]